MLGTSPQPEGITNPPIDDLLEKVDSKYGLVVEAAKRARQTERRTEVNKSRRSRVRGFIRKVEEAIASGDQTAAAEALRLAQPELARGVSKGVVHKNTAARKMSRLASRVKGLAVVANA